ncbi:MAG: 30S ribosomal protein S15 [Planctomycetota bacterium]|nr:30S ribosomal protein S15 [Planctomycetota bacterium]
MALTLEARQDIVKKYQTAPNDTGSCEVQVALLTEHILLMTEHLKQHAKDFHSRRGLEAMVSKRTRLLTYLRKRNLGRYKSLIERLGLRK